MDANEIEQLAEAMVRKQAEAEAKKAADAAAAAEAQAKVDAEQAEKDRVAAERKAAERAEADRVAAEREAKVDAILSSVVGDVLLAPDGSQHRVVGVTSDGIDTVGRGSDGDVIGNWRDWKPEVSVLADWRKKV